MEGLFIFAALIVLSASLIFLSKRGKTKKEGFKGRSGSEEIEQPKGIDEDKNLPI